MRYALSLRMISIHALREEGDKIVIGLNEGVYHFYPRPPRGGRQAQLVNGVQQTVFLSTPSARRATRGAKIDLDIDVFLSTPSARRATAGALNLVTHDLISIHALREEGDTKVVEPLDAPDNFLAPPSARRATRRHRH